MGSSAGTDAAAAAYKRSAAAVTDMAVSPPDHKGGRRWRRPTAASGVEPRAKAQAEEVLSAYAAAISVLNGALRHLGDLDRPRLLGKVVDEQRRLTIADRRLGEARTALSRGDIGECGKALNEAHRELSDLGGPMASALNQELGQAAIGRRQKAELEANVEGRREAQAAADRARQSSPRAGMLAAAAMFHQMAQGLELAADILSQQGAPRPMTRNKSRSDNDVRVVSPDELETFADIGGLGSAVEHLRRTIGAVLERGDAAGLVHNGILLHGPPGTGKTLLARAVAGEYGLRFIRFSPSAIASAYQHEPAKKLRQIFELAADSAPCLLFLDEVDVIAGRRDGATSADQRQVITQLLNSLEEYRGSPGLVIMAATNTLDQLDPALREGRFDSRVAVPLPDAAAREEILTVLLEARDVDVDWDAVDLGEVAQRTGGRSGAFLGGVVNGAAERALVHGGELTQADLLAEIQDRSGQDRAQTLEDRIGWDDVVLPAAVRQRLQEILLVFQRPELGRQLGVRPPAGILLYGPPGTGKTTIARALATEVKASFYEQSAADIMSKWVGETEQKVAQLFTRARANRPSIIFCDEIDALLKRRTADSSTPWEERVVSQFLRELDGLHSGEGVLLVGSTNRPDMIDDAVRERRLVPIEIPLPDRDGRRHLLDVLWREVRVGPDVDFDEVADATDGMSGADLKAVRDSAGMKALSRAAMGDGTTEVAVTRTDFATALSERDRELGGGGKRRGKPKQEK